MFSWLKRNLFEGRKHCRILWILNHKTLLASEVPLLESFGYEVFVPQNVPGGSEYVSATGRHAGRLTLDSRSADLLRTHRFYTDPWPPALSETINRSFDLVVTSVIDIPLVQTLKHFRKPIIARVFGREGTGTYGKLFEYYPECAQLVASVGERFIFAQSYANIALIEEPDLQRRAVTIGCGIPQSMLQYKNTWKGGSRNLLFLCPRISQAYYRGQYDIIKREFGSLPHLIMGAQTEPHADSSVLGYLSDEDLFALYASTAAFAYISVESRHLHYSPLEAMLVGAPVLYMKDSQLSHLAGQPLPGECSSYEEMREKATRLSQGDTDLGNAIRRDQHIPLGTFSDDVIRSQWANLFAKIA